MKSMVKLQRLDSMIGGEYFYNGNKIKIDGAKFENGKIFIASGKEVIEIQATEIEKFVEAPKEKIMLSVLPHNGKLEELRDVVLNNIEKLKISSEFIPQAEAINDSINTLVNLAKIELQSRIRMRDR